MQLVSEIMQSQKKARLPAVRSGDTVRVHHQIKEGSKTRVQVFEGLVIRTRRLNSLTAMITVRRIASGVGVEKDIMLHAPSIIKVEVKKRGKVRRNYLTYMRERHGKSARLTDKGFDSDIVNVPGEETLGAAEPEVAEPTAKAEAPEETSKAETKETEEAEAKPAKKAKDAKTEEE